MFKITQFPIFVKLLKYAIFIRQFLGTWMHDNKTILLHLEAGVLTWRKCNNFYFLFNTIKYILCIMYAYFGNFSCPNSTKMAKITWPVSMATRFKSHKSDTGFWLFALRDTSCANFIKETIDFRLYWKFLGPYREAILSRSLFLYYRLGGAERGMVHADVTFYFDTKLITANICVFIFITPLPLVTVGTRSIYETSRQLIRYRKAAASLLWQQKNQKTCSKGGINKTKDTSHHFDTFVLENNSSLGMLII